MNVLKISILPLFLISTSCIAQDTTYQYRIKHYHQKINAFLDKEKKLSGHYKMDSEGIKIFASSQDKLLNNAEFKVDWKGLDSFSVFLKNTNEAVKKEVYSSGAYTIESCKKYLLKLPETQTTTNKDSTTVLWHPLLLNYKIAIDAGHIAGDFETGKMEMKYLNFKKDSILGLSDSIQIAEGTLTFATAQLLKEKLEQQGAIVFLTRKKNGYTAFNKTFDQWLKDDYIKTIDSLGKIGRLGIEKKNWYLSAQRTKREKFSLVFKDLELAKRADIINDFKPDFTIIIHFNVDETNTGWTKPGTKNFNMTFIGGAYMPNDLSSSEKRFEFLRMLVTDDIEKSIKLSAATINSFEKTLKVKTAGPTDAKYLREGCIATSEKGVFCRNLQLTRYIHSPLVYGETLYQDNINECKMLNKEGDKTKNERIKQVAEAYYQGVLNYLSK